MVIFVLLAETAQLDGWRCTTLGCGEQSVTIGLMVMKPGWLVDSWVIVATLVMVTLESTGK